MEQHRGIVFRAGPAGRRAALASGPDVWEVASVFRNLRASGEEAIEETAELTGLDSGQVRAAVCYYADYRDEIDAWIDRVASEAEQAEAAWRRGLGVSA